MVDAEHGRGSNARFGRQGVGFRKVPRDVTCNHQEDWIPDFSFLRNCLCESRNETNALALAREQLSLRKMDDQRLLTGLCGVLVHGGRAITFLNAQNRRKCLLRSFFGCVTGVFTATIAKVVPDQLVRRMAFVVAVSRLALSGVFVKGLLELGRSLVLVCCGQSLKVMQGQGDQSGAKLLCQRVNVFNRDIGRCFCLE